MYINNNYDMNDFDARVESIQASQIFEKPQLMQSHDLAGDNRACELQLCSVPFKITFALDHSANTITFSLFLLNETEAKPVVENRLITLEEFLDTNPKMTLDQLCQSVVELLTRHAEEFMPDAASDEEQVLQAVRGFIEQEL